MQTMIFPGYTISVSIGCTVRIAESSRMIWEDDMTGVRRTAFVQSAVSIADTTGK